MLEKKQLKGKEVKRKRIQGKEIKGKGQAGYSSLDVCVCCGRYMPEGTGMVCLECLKKYG
ncbi:MAG: hypothetical protein ACOX8H_14385 [Ruminococcus sp.]|jgi:hypothetical protein